MFNIAYEAATKAEAKTELHIRNDDQPEPMSADMVDAIERVIDALDGTGNIGVACYGSDGQLNLTVARR